MPFYSQNLHNTWIVLFLLGWPETLPWQGLHLEVLHFCFYYYSHWVSVTLILYLVSCLWGPVTCQLGGLTDRKIGLTSKHFFSILLILLSEEKHHRKEDMKGEFVLIIRILKWPHHIIYTLQKHTCNWVTLAYNSFNHKPGLFALLHSWLELSLQETSYVLFQSRIW